jgi:hypothetical protein
MSIEIPGLPRFKSIVNRSQLGKSVVPGKLLEFEELDEAWPLPPVADQRPV